jgi:transcriptional regulator with XRE-family HTH domain
VAEHSIPEIVRLLRKELEYSRVQLAAAIGSSESSVRNWERGLKRPSPTVMKKMRGLATPGLAARLTEAIRQFEWHPKSPEQSRRPGQQPVELDIRIEQQHHIAALANSTGLDMQVILDTVLRLGLTSLTPEKLIRAVAEHQATISRRVYERHHPESKNKRDHSKTA